MKLIKNNNKKYSYLRAVCLGILILLIMAVIPAINADNRADGSMSMRESRNDADHLVLNEICTSPTAWEFIEIFNPTNDIISLENYYLADIIDYYNITNRLIGFDYQAATDFAATFPDGSTIEPGEYQVVAFKGEEFIGEYGMRPNYCFNQGGSPLMNGTRGFIGGSASLSDAEMIAFFHWDGIDDLVEDVDIVWWGTNVEFKVNKTDVEIDSDSDGDLDNSSYNEDAGTYPAIYPGGHTSGKSFKRINLTEKNEVDSGGNGITGHDETTEQLNETWNRDTAADPTVTYPIGGPPIIIHVKKAIGDSNALLESNVTLEAKVVDEGTIDRVELNISIGGGTYRVEDMNSTGNNNYQYVVLWDDQSMESTTSVRYNVTALDEHGNITRSVDYIYYYLPDIMPEMIMTEVMFNASGDGNNWIELYCIDDNNADRGNSLLNWATNDIDGEDDVTMHNALVATGETVLLHYNEPDMPYEWNSSDGNGNGILDIYLSGDNNRLDGEGDQVVLYDLHGDEVDAVCWAYNDHLSQVETNDLTAIAGTGHWNSADPALCVDSENIFEGLSISRSRDEADSNSRVDWHLLNTPNPGIYYNKSDLAPFIHNVSMFPEPIEDTMLPMTDINITVRISDEVLVLSSNITWSLNGTGQTEISLRDDGVGADEVSDDGNWSGILPGQTNGSVVIFSIEAFDPGLQRSVSAPVTITYREPPRYPTLLITEIMLSPDEGGDWVEIYCEDDDNEGGGAAVPGWELDDLENTRFRFGQTVMRTGEYMLIHFDNDTGADELNSSGGNSDGIIDLYTDASNTIMATGGDQIVILNDDGVVMDAVAWQRDGTLSGAEPSDMEYLLGEGMWDSSAVNSCINVTGMDAGESLARNYDHGISRYYDENSKQDWYIASEPTPGWGNHSLPPEFEFTVLADHQENADEEFTVSWNWSFAGGEDMVNVSLFYCNDSLASDPVFIATVEPSNGTYDWKTSILPNGSYYLQAQINDSVNSLFTINTTYALEVIHTPVLPPLVVSTKPSNGTKSLLVSSDITVTFNRKMDIDSFRAGTTFVTDPSIDGEFTLEDDVSVVFDPSISLNFNTTYDITVEGVYSQEGMKINAPYHFSFTTEIQPLYGLTGTVIPENATVTIDRDPVEVDSGSFLVMLPNGTYDIVVFADGYETYTETFSVLGADKALGLIKLDEKEIPPIEYEVRIGPFLYKGTDDGIEGIDVSFSIGEDSYSGKTDSEGYIRFLITEMDIPRGTEITAKKDGKTVTWKWGNDDAPYEAFEKKSDNGNGKKTTDDGASNTALIIILVVLVILIVGVIIAILVYLARSKKKAGDSEPPAAGPEFSPDEHPEGIAEAEPDVVQEELMPEPSTGAGDDAPDDHESPASVHPSEEEVVTVETSVTVTKETSTVTIEETSEALTELQPPLLPVETEENESAASKLDAVFAHFSETDKPPEEKISDDDLLDE